MAAMEMAGRSRGRPSAEALRRHVCNLDWLGRMEGLFDVRACLRLLARTYWKLKERWAVDVDPPLKCPHCGADMQIGLARATSAIYVAECPRRLVVEHPQYIYVPTVEIK